ncbi:scaffold protein CheW associated with MCPs of classes 40H and 40+24H [Geotalea daltonii FRC-32]|uniref:Chemotaxis protein CheW n=1 Tax=Geotalea daltonii (strain DSM 22248 / JCM 15807 / FRC-32) TaxID=316067 RepID=B9M7Q9_GEODF|nr:chemotaxis protein CheW [Geotalea daltonii]ACM22165.1 scaffold protein CheW associated with MCPs of classes 40H and 40+24H [Geotalea daltonii FRC-32]
MENALQVRNESVTGELIQLVSFCLDHEEYGVNVLKVREIIRLLNITRVPNAPSYVDGVINLRGKVIPIISLRKKFNLPDAEIDKRTRIMVIESGSEMMGFIVDEVSEVIRISAHDIQPPPPVANSTIDLDCMSGVVNQAERLLVLLDLEKMCTHEDNMLFSNAMN